jgi:hypothetical protein
MKENGLSWKIENVVYDAGHDATGIYEYLMENEIKPVIALNERTGVHPSPTGTAEKVDANGTPICPAGKLMRRHYYDKKKKRIYSGETTHPSEWGALLGGASFRMSKRGSMSNLH